MKILNTVGGVAVLGLALVTPLSHSGGSEPNGRCQVPEI